MLQANTISTPLVGHLKLSGHHCPKFEKEKQAMKHGPYTNVVDCLMYKVVCTRPDLAQAISVVSKYMKIQKVNIGNHSTLREAEM